MPLWPLQDPVLVIEHVDLYGVADQVPEGDLDYVIPPGRAAIRRAGSEVTVISYLSMVNHCLEAIEQTDIDAELIDLRWLDRASIDWDTITASVRKTNAVLIVEQGARGTSYGGWLADEIQRRLFDWLDQPVERVTGDGGVAEHLEGARTRRHRQDRGSRRRPREGPCGNGATLMPTVVRMPEVLANAGEAIIQTWLVTEGQEIAVGDPLAEIETEKAVVEYVAEVDGDRGPADRRSRARRSRWASRSRWCWRRARPTPTSRPPCTTVSPCPPHRSPNSPPSVSPNPPPRPTGGDCSPPRWCESWRANGESNSRA